MAKCASYSLQKSREDPPALNSWNPLRTFANEQKYLGAELAIATAIRDFTVPPCRSQHSCSRGYPLKIDGKTPPFTRAANHQGSIQAKEGLAHNLCVVQPAVNVLSETYIAAPHTERLPAHVTVVHGVNSGRSCIGDKPVLSQTIPCRAMRKLGRITLRRPWEWEITASLLAAFRRVRPQAVLAEYGTTAVLAMEACRLARVPLIAHFHGFDATKKCHLEEYREGYLRLFRTAKRPLSPFRRPCGASLFRSGRCQRTFAIVRTASIAHNSAVRTRLQIRQSFSP